MPINAKNGARATLAAGITASATSVTLASGHGARMPVVPFNAWIYNATDYADDPHDDPNYEIVRVTARSTDTLTIVRAQEGTIAATHNTGSKVYRFVAGLTADVFNTLLPYADYYNAKMYGLRGDGTTDDTVALQTLIDLVATAGGGTIYFPPGVYLIAGPLQDTGGRNAQLLLPWVWQGDELVTVTLLGAMETPQAFWTGSTTKPTGRAYSIIKSTLTGASGTASLIAGTVGGNSYFNNLTVNVRSLIVELPPNPTFTALDLSTCLQGDLSYVLVYTGTSDLDAVTEPTHTNSYAIKMPAENRSSRTKMDFVMIMGFRSGIRLGEASDLTGVAVWACVTALEVPSAAHASLIQKIQIVWCAYGLIATGSHPLIITILDFEHGNSTLSAAWQYGGTDVLDSSNQLKGNCKYIVKNAGGIGTETFTKVGGVNFLTSLIGT